MGDKEWWLQHDYMNIQDLLTEWKVSWEMLGPRKCGPGGILYLKGICEKFQQHFSTRRLRIDLGMQSNAQ